MPMGIQIRFDRQLWWEDSATAYKTVFTEGLTNWQVAFQLNIPLAESKPGFTDRPAADPEAAERS